MKASKLCVLVLVIFIGSSSTKEYFKSSNKTILFTTIDETTINVELIPEYKAYVMLKLRSENLCEENAQRNKNINVTQPNQIQDVKTPKNFNRICSDCDNFIFSSSLFLRSILSCIVNSVGSFLIFLTDNEIPFSDSDLIDMLNQTWTEKGALKVYISICDNIYSYDPFYRNDNDWGKINSFSDPDVELKLKNMKGHRINVEMFSGPFTVSRVANPSSIDDFFGPDVDASRFIGEKLNATSIRNSHKVLFHYLLILFFQ